MKCQPVVFHWSSESEPINFADSHLFANFKQKPGWHMMY